MTWPTNGSSQMDITFTRSGERDYTTQVRRDGLTLHVPSHDRPTWLPHDLEHYLVERELGLQRGFWGCVAAGALFPGMKVVAGRQAPHAAARSQAVIRESDQQGTEAEVLVSLLRLIAEEEFDNDWPRVQAVLKDRWQREKPSRGALIAAEVKRVCTLLREAHAQWRALPVGGSISVSWPHSKSREK